MDRFLRYVAYLLNVLQILAVFYFLTQAYGRDVYFVLLMGLPPLFSFLAIMFSPDLEERHLARLLNKARLKKELKSLDEG